LNLESRGQIIISDGFVAVNAAKATPRAGPMHGPEGSRTVGIGPPNDVETLNSGMSDPQVGPNYPIVLLNLASECRQRY
jgi:hypothetical protein